MKENKFFKRFSIFDLLIVVLIIFAAVMAFGSGFLSKPAAGDKAATLEYTVSIIGVRQNTVDAIKSGMGLLDGETGSAIGEITSVAVTEDLEPIRLADGTIKQVSVPERFNVTVTVRSSGSENDLGYYANGRQIAPAGDIKIVGTGLSTNGRIISVATVA